MRDQKPDSPAMAKRGRGRPKSPFTEPASKGMQSLERALGLLSLVARHDQPTLSNLARDSAIPTATTHRILATLQAAGFVTHHEDRQEWRIGLEAYRTGIAFLAQATLAEVGRPVMRRLMRETGETANLAVREQADVVFVAQIETPHPIRAFFPPGTRTSMHASGIGKAILAALPGPARADAFGRIEFTGYTGNTLTSEEALEADLARIRARGWSHDREERHMGMSCIAAAIFDAAGEPVAGVSVSGPTARIAPDLAWDLGASVVQAAQEITEASGGVWPRSDT